MKNFGWLYEVNVEDFPGIGPMEEVLMEGEKLKRQRIALGLTQQQVADAARINIRQYQRFESSKRSIYTTSLRTGLKICHALKIDPMYYCKTKYDD